MDYTIANLANSIRFAAAGFFAVVVVLAMAPFAQAESTMTALVCNSSQPATITISQPQSDSVVTNPEVEISGSVSQSNGLEVYINDVYNSVQPLAFDATSYTTTVTLSPGTHTIKIIAIDACQVGNAAASIVLTHQPEPTKPSTGNEVPTNVGNNTPSTSTDALQSGSLLDRLVIAPLISIGKALDLISDHATSSDQTRANAIRFSFVVAGLLAIIFASWLSTSAIRLAKRLHAPKSLVASLQSRARKSFIGLGVISIILVFIL